MDFSTSCFFIRLDKFHSLINDNGHGFGCGFGLSGNYCISNGLMSFNIGSFYTFETIG